MKPFFDSQERIERLRFAGNLWHGTPFRKRARILHHGVDCANLAVAIYCDGGFPIDAIIPHYHLDHGRHSKESILVHWLSGSKYFEEVKLSDGLRPGDILCFMLEQSEHHCGIVMSSNSFAHCVDKLGTIFSRLDDSTYRINPTKPEGEQERISAVFRPIEQ